MKEIAAEIMKALLQKFIVAKRMRRGDFYLGDEHAST